MSTDSNGIHSGDDLKEIGVRPDRLNEETLKEIIRLLGFPDLAISDLNDWLTKMNEKSGHREVLLGDAASQAASSHRLPRVTVVMHSQEEVLQALNHNQETVEAIRDMARNRTRTQKREMRHPEDAFPERDLVHKGETLNPTQTRFMSKLNEALGAECSAPKVLTEEWMMRLIRAFYPKQEGSPVWHGRIRCVFSGDRALHLSGKRGLKVFELPAAAEDFESLRAWMVATIPEDYKALTDEKEELNFSQLVGLSARFRVELDSSEQSALGTYLKGKEAEGSSLKNGLKKFLQASGGKAVLIGERNCLDAATQELLDELEQEDVKPYLLVKSEESSSLGGEIMERILRLPVPELSEAPQETSDYSGTAVERQFRLWEELLEMALESSLDVEVISDEEIPDTLTVVTRERVFRAVRREGALEIMAFYAACLLPHQDEYKQLGERIRKLLPEGMTLPEVQGDLWKGVPLKQLEAHIKKWEETGVVPFSVGWEQVEEVPALAAEALGNQNGEVKIYLHEGDVYKVEKRGFTEAQKRYRKRLEQILGTMDFSLDAFSIARIERVEKWEPEVRRVVCSLEEKGEIAVLDLLKCTPEQRAKLQDDTEGAESLVLLCMNPSALNDSALGHIAQAYFSEKMSEFTEKAVLELDDPNYIQALEDLKNAMRLVELGLDYKKAIPLIRAEVDRFFGAIAMTMDEWMAGYESEGNHVHIDDSVGVLLQWALAGMIQKAKEAADDHNLALAQEAHPFIHKMWKFLRSKINKEKGIAFEDEYSFVMAETAEEMARVQLDAIRLGVQGTGRARLAPLEVLRTEYMAMSRGDSLPSAPEKVLQPLLQLYFDFTKAYIQGDYKRCKELFGYAFNESSIPYEEQFMTIALPGRWPAVAEQGGFPCFIKFNTKANDLAWKMALMTMEASRRTQDRPMFDRAIGVFKAASGKPAPYVQANYLREIGHWELENGGVERCDVQVANRAYREAAHILEKRDPRDPKRVDFLNFSAEIRKIEALQHLRVFDELDSSMHQEKSEALTRAVKASFVALELLNTALDLNPDNWVYKISHFQAVFRLYSMHDKCTSYPGLQKSLRARAPEQGEDVAAIFADVSKLAQASDRARTILLAQGGGTVKAYAGEIVEELKAVYSGKDTIIHALIDSWEALKNS